MTKSVSFQEVEELFFEWLCRKVRVSHRPEKELLRVLQETEYHWEHRMDQNRSDDGKYLRVLFARFKGLDAPAEWFEVGCSILEFLVALSVRFETLSGIPRGFQLMIRNSDLISFVGDLENPELRDACASINDGRLFPLKDPAADREQGSREIWMQMSYYLNQIF